MFGTFLFCCPSKVHDLATSELMQGWIFLRICGWSIQEMFPYLVLITFVVNLYWFLANLSNLYNLENSSQKPLTGRYLSSHVPWNLSQEENFSQKPLLGRNFFCPGYFFQPGISLPWKSFPVSDLSVCTAFVTRFSYDGCYIYIYKALLIYESKSKCNDIFNIAIQICSYLHAIFWEEFISLEMNILEKFPIFWKYSPLSVCNQCWKWPVMHI